MSKSVSVASVNRSSVSVVVRGRKSEILWHDLSQAASAANGDAELRGIYESVLVEAVGQLRSLPLSCQGLAVVVWTITGGATWEVSVIDAAGDYRRDLMMADEGGSEPHKSLAEKSAQSIASRIGCDVRVEA